MTQYAVSYTHLDVYKRQISDCADEQMYIGYMMPPLAVMAVMTMGYGVCMLLNDLRETPFLPYPWPLVILAAVLGSLVWYRCV